MNDHWNVPCYHYDPSCRYANKLPVIKDWQKSRDIEYRNGDYIEAGKHSSELFTDAALDFLKTRSNENPFFLYVALMAPHDPRTMPEKFLSMYNARAIKLPGNFMAQHPFDTGALRVRDEMLAALPRNPDEIRQHIAEYYAMISHLDYELGRLLDYLEQNQLADNTIIIFSGDNGLALGQHGLMGKQNNYEHSLRVPLLFAGPGIPAGVKSSAYTYLFDIFPTICDLTGTGRPADLDGISLVPCFNNTSEPLRDELYCAYSSTIRSVKNRRHKLIEYACGEQRATQLFELENDPLEMNNIAGRSEYKNTVAEMKRRLSELSVLWGDTGHEKGRTFWQNYR